MPEYLIRVYQTQLLQGYADVMLNEASAEAAASVVLDAANGDPDDVTDSRRYQLPDGRSFPLDPEDTVIGGRIFCHVLDGDGKLLGAFGDLQPCDAGDDVRPATSPPELRLTPRERDALSALLNEEIMATGSNTKARTLTTVLRKLGG